MNEKRDEVREDLFNQAYGMKPEVYIKYELNPDRTFKMFSIRFVWKDHSFYLVEHYKENTNMTDFCDVVEHPDYGSEVYPRFVDAEKRIVELMKRWET